MKRARGMRNQEIEPGSFEFERIQPFILTQSQLIELLHAEGLIYKTADGYGLTPKGMRIFKKSLPVREEVIAWGHPNIRGTHETTFEVTKEENVTENGDCIIGVRANKGCADLSEEVKEALKEGKKVKLTLIVDDVTDVAEAVGSPALRLTNKTSIVVRKSDYIDDRTLAIMCNKAAKDLDRRLIQKLKNPEQKLRIVIEVL